MPFPRYYKPGCLLTVSTNVGVPLLTVSHTGVLPRNIHEPRVAFRVVKSESQTPDTAEITVWGLDEVRRRALSGAFGATGTATFRLLAGYESQFSQLFAGDLRRIRANIKQGQDFLTIFSGDEGGDAFSEVTVSIPPIPQGVNVANMVDTGIAAFLAGAPPKVPSFPIIKHPSVDFLINASPASQIQWPLVQIGRASELFDQAARIVGARWYLRGRDPATLYFVKKGVPVGTAPVPLPRALYLSEPTEDGAGLIRGTYLFDPAVEVGGLVTLIGRVAPGVPEPLQVENIVFEGDTYGSTPWSMKVAARRNANL